MSIPTTSRAPWHFEAKSDATSCSACANDAQFSSCLRSSNDSPHRNPSWRRKPPGNRTTWTGWSTSVACRTARVRRCSRSFGGPGAGQPLTETVTATPVGSEVIVHPQGLWARSLPALWYELRYYHYNLLFFIEFLAEREGFEPSMRFRIHTFQACSFDRSDTSPGLRLLAGRRSGPASSRHTLWLLPLLPSGPGGVHNLTLREDRTGPPSIRPSGQRSLAEVGERKQVVSCRNQVASSRAGRPRSG